MTGLEAIEMLRSHDVSGSKMRVLLLTRKHPPAVGGMEKLSGELANAIDKIAETRVIAWGGSQKWLPLFLPYCLVRAVVEIVRWRPDVVHLGDGVMSVVGAPLRALTGTPTTVTVHGLDVTYSRWGYQKLVVPLLRHLDRIVCVSSETRSECDKRGLGASAVVIHNGICPEKMPSVTERGEAAVRAALADGHGDYKVITTVGRLVPRKGVAEFIRTVLPEVILQYPNVKYWVVGEGPDRRQIEAAVNSAGLTEHVTLWGRVSDGVLAAIYDRADLFVMPNISVKDDMEGFGLVALEANLRGTAVVASRLEGIRDAITHGENGILVEETAKEAWTREILDLLNDDRRRAELVERARQHTLKRFGWKQIADDYVNALFETCTSKRLREGGASVGERHDTG